MDHLRFLSAAVRDRKVGALCPTSISNARSICRSVDAGSPVVVVEYGPGTGVFTRRLIQQVHPDSTILAVELNRGFAGRLRRYNKLRKTKTPRLIVAKSNALNVGELLERHGLGRADYVLSGIPFSFLDARTRVDLIDRTHEALVPGGRFVAYQYSFLLKDVVAERFGNVKARRLLIGLPPLCVMEACKRFAEDSAVGKKLLRQSLRPSASVHAG
jgi:phospholipid N-methyltransferase